MTIENQVAGSWAKHTMNRGRIKTLGNNFVNNSGFGEWAKTNIGSPQTATDPKRRLQASQRENAGQLRPACDQETPLPGLLVIMQKAGYLL